MKKRSTKPTARQREAKLAGEQRARRRLGDTAVDVAQYAPGRRVLKLNEGGRRGILQPRKPGELACRRFEFPRTDFSSFGCVGLAQRGLRLRVIAQAEMRFGERFVIPAQVLAQRSAVPRRLACEGG